MNLPRVGLVGLGGYGRVHLQHLRDFHQRGEIVLAAAVAFPPEQGEAETVTLREAGCVVVFGFDELIAELPRLKLDLVVVPTPIHLHARMTIALLQAGVDVLVEKPLAATTAEVAAITAAMEATGRMVAVGFQYLHAPEVQALKQQLQTGAIGTMRRLVVHAAWPRSHAYYTRNAWAGQLRLGEDWVLDSPVSNAMSHFLMVMLFLAGRTEADVAAPVRLGAELYRAQAIKSFDTAVIHLETAEGLRLDFYGTHSSREIGRPSLRIEGDHGEAEWVQDSHAKIDGLLGPWAQRAAPESDTRERMLRAVLARHRGEPVFVCTPAVAAVHVSCVAELYQRVPITPILPAHLARYHDDGQDFTYVPGLDEQLARASLGGLSLAAAGAPWAGPEPSLAAIGGI